MATEPDGCDALLADWTNQLLVPAKLWSDASIAAFAIKGGWRVGTLAPDHERFDALEVLLQDT